MASLKDILGDSYREDMSLSDIESIVSGMKLVDLASGDYVSKAKATDYEARMKKAEKALAEKMSAEEKAQAEADKREEYYKSLEKELARGKYVAKLGKTIKDEKVVEEIADLYAEGKFTDALDKQNEYFAKYHKDMEKEIKDNLMKKNPQSNPRNDNLTYKTKDEILAIKDTQARQKAIAENFNLFENNS